MRIRKNKFGLRIFDDFDSLAGGDKLVVGKKSHDDQQYTTGKAKNEAEPTVDHTQSGFGNHASKEWREQGDYDQGQNENKGKGNDQRNFAAIPDQTIHKRNFKNQIFALRGKNKGNDGCTTPADD